MTLNDLIRYHKNKLDNPDLTRRSREITEATLRELEGKKALLSRITDEMQTCTRYGDRAIKTCEVCESCMEGDELDGIISGVDLADGEDFTAYPPKWDGSNPFSVQYVGRWVEKKTPLKVRGISLTYDGRVGNCPKCGKFIRECDNLVTCEHCFQAIAWNEGDE